METIRFRYIGGFVLLLREMRKIEDGTLGISRTVDFDNKFLLDKKCILFGETAVCTMQNTG